MRSGLHWKERWPDLRIFLEDHVAHAVTKFGYDTYMTLDEAWERSYMPGLAAHLSHLTHHIGDKATMERRDIIAELERWYGLLMYEYRQEIRSDRHA